MRFAKWSLILPVICLLLVGTGCGDDGTGTTNVDPFVAEGCNPLAPNWDCLLPYPTDYFLVEDDALPGGYRVVIPASSLPVNEEGITVDPMAVHPADGFSVIPQILLLFPFDLDDGNLVFHTDDIYESTGPDSPTVLMEADTGLRILHFAEMDPCAESDERRGLLIRPLERLENATRYIVAVRRLRRLNGEPVPAGEGFQRLRDGTAGSHTVLGLLEDHYEQNIFPQLDQAQIDRAELQIAWDFTTATEENVTSALLQARNLAMAVMEATPPAVTITDEYFDPYDDGVMYSRVQGTIEVPLYVEDDRPGAMINRDAQGQVTQAGTGEAKFTILIPNSVVDATPFEPARLLQFGHGFFGSQKEVEGSFVRSFVDRTQMVVIGIDWWGMSTQDYPDVISDIFSDASHALDFTDRVHQAMVNQIAVTYAARSTLQEVPELQVNGTLVFNPDEIYYYGISQGHILGGTYIALSPHISRAVLDVGGCAISFMMFRSANFAAFLEIISMTLPDDLDKQKFVALTQTVFERIDPITYAPHVINDTYPGSPSQRLVLMHTGVGDTQVPNLASHLHARTLGLTQLLPSTRMIQALAAEEGPLSISAVVEFDFGIADPLPGTYAEPPAEINEVHEGVRQLDAAQEQIDQFLRPDGIIENFCDGACDPE